MAIAAPATVELERFVRLRAVLVPGTSPIDVDAIVLRRERRGPVTHWGLQIHDIPSYVLSQIVDFVNTELERVKVKTPAAIERAVIGEDDDIRVIYDQALSQLAS